MHPCRSIVVVAKTEEAANAVVSQFGFSPSEEISADGWRAWGHWVPEHEAAAFIHEAESLSPDVVAVDGTESPWWIQVGWWYPEQ